MSVRTTLSEAYFFQANIHNYDNTVWFKTNKLGNMWGHGVFLGNQSPILNGRYLTAPNFEGSSLFMSIAFVWLGGRVVRTLDSRSVGREFES